MYGPYKYSVSTFGYVLPKTLKTDYRGYLLPTHPIGWDVEKSGGFSGRATPTADTHDDHKVVSIKRVAGDRGGSLRLPLPHFPLPLRLRVLILRISYRY